MATTLILTFVTLIAFAANSILCRLALRSELIGPLEFTIVRLFSGLLILLPLILFYDKLNRKELIHSETKKEVLAVSWRNAAPSIFLFGYALFFSLAYVQLDAAIGALILFPTVQIAMMGISIYFGNRVSLVELIGFGVSFAGLVYLLLPGLTAPPPVGTVMMMLSGICWAIYSILGQMRKQPILSTARNFLYCLPGILVLIIFLVGFSGSGGYHATAYGIWLAVLSGAAASAIGYVLWYISLTKLSTTTASIAQLSVPVLVGIGGIVFLNESLTLRLAIASVLILGGIFVTILGKPSGKSEKS